MKRILSEKLYHIDSIYHCWLASDTQLPTKERRNDSKGHTISHPIFYEMKQSPDTGILITEVLFLFSLDGPCSSSAIRYVISIFPVGTRLIYSPYT